VGRVLLVIGGFLLATLVVCVPIGILGSSNIVWGEDDQYGRVDIPGTGVVHLPADSVDVNVAIALPGRGNETPELPLPSNLAMTVTPVSGTTQPTVTRDVGDSSNANDNEVDTQRQVWVVDVPVEGDYRIIARGDFRSIGVNAQLWFGHGPPLPGTLVPVVAAAVVLIAGLVLLIIKPGVRRWLLEGTVDEKATVR
jgi:hypothetical protein